MDSKITPEQVTRALAGDPAAQGWLVEALTPEIQWQVGKMLRRWRTGTAAGRELRQEIEDMVQEVFLELLEDDGKSLRRWDPERLPLTAYVGYIARIRTAEVLRSRRSPWREHPSPDHELDRPATDATPEHQALSRGELEKVYLCLLAGFSPDDGHLFDLLFVRQLAAQQVAEVICKSIDAVYKWRSRLYRRARKCRRLLSNPAPSRQRGSRKV